MEYIKEGPEYNSIKSLALKRIQGWGGQNISFGMARVIGGPAESINTVALSEIWTEYDFRSEHEARWQKV